MAHVHPHRLSADLWTRLRQSKAHELVHGRNMQGPGHKTPKVLERSVTPGGIAGVTHRCRGAGDISAAERSRRAAKLRSLGHIGGDRPTIRLALRTSIGCALTASLSRSILH